MRHGFSAPSNIYLSIFECRAIDSSLSHYLLVSASNYGQTPCYSFFVFYILVTVKSHAVVKLFGLWEKNKNDGYWVRCHTVRCCRVVKMMPMSPGGTSPRTVSHTFLCFLFRWHTIRSLFCWSVRRPIQIQNRGVQNQFTLERNNNHLSHSKGIKPI